MVVSFVKCAQFWVCTFVRCAHLLGVHIYILVGVNEKLPSHFKQICYTLLIESNVMEKTFTTVKYLMKPVSNTVIPTLVSLMISTATGGREGTTTVLLSLLVSTD